MLENKKLFLTSGCSFTAYHHCWPNHIIKNYDMNLINVAEQSQGNGLISRKLIHNLFKILETTDPKDIIVGIMWSGIDRGERYIYNNDDDEYIGEPKITVNPTAIVENNRNWRMMSHHWTTSKDCELFYKLFLLGPSAMVYTLEHILRVQWLLKNLNIDYFMTTYTDIFIDELINHPEASYLYKQVDFSKFLPVKGCYEWVKNNHPVEGFRPPDENGVIDWHPSEFGQKKFTENIIIPFLRKKTVF